ncbi:MAG: S4 domain-containing protein YaaA [Bacilli bacterium]|nr:S4 domain-containing protein YaaA [Bacilli bacterium]MBR4811613.1 S4 domain-containing protein YaaA [Bacilli bacterium]MBR6225894.1 S4 domain-containing protein YaaA [Bacilli bacterium]
MPKNASEIAITTEFITLGQFLKLADIISQGGEAKAYLATHEVKVNGESDNRRGRKLRNGDEVLLPEGLFRIVQK